VVQGSRVTPYQVTIGLEPFTQLAWAKAEVVLAEQAIFSARLLAGEFPPDLEDVFAGIGAPLFPRRLGDLTMQCSCPDHAVPCKHLAAVFYLLAERFDTDPFLILRWRGRSRDDLLARLRELRGDEAPSSTTPVFADGDEPLPDARSGEPGPGALTPPIGGATHALPRLLAADGPPPASDLTAIGAGAMSFWAAGEPPPLPAQPELPVDLLLRLLPVPGSTLGGTRLTTYLTPLYQRLP